jgi:DNA-binding transcriptional regulator YiaG
MLQRTAEIGSFRAAALCPRGSGDKVQRNAAAAAPVAGRHATVAKDATKVEDRAMNAPFSERFSLILKALSVSRGRIAADLGVDKSLVGRWASGTVRPSEHNLANLTRLIAGRLPGFTMLDWDRDIAAFARLCGVDAPAQRPDPAAMPMPPLLPESLIRSG